MVKDVGLFSKVLGHNFRYFWWGPRTHSENWVCFLLFERQLMTMTSIRLGCKMYNLTEFRLGTIAPAISPK